MKHLLSHDLLNGEPVYHARILPSSRIRWLIQYVMLVLTKEGETVQEKGMIRCVADAKGMAEVVRKEVEKISNEVVAREEGLIEFKYKAYKV